MRRLIVLLAIPSAFAQAPADFRSTVAVTPAKADALHRLTLPFEAYRDTRPGLPDLRLFNARGEPLPIAYAGEPEAVRESVPAVSLPLFPVTAAARRERDAIDVKVRSDRDGTIVTVQGRRQGATVPQRPVAWIADASQMKVPVRALVVGWDVQPGAQVVRVTVEASDDLKSWRTVASAAPLLHLEHGGQTLTQPKVDLGALRTKYLRVTGSPEAFRLASLHAEPDTATRPAPRAMKSVAATPGSKPGEFLVDLGARLPVEAVRVSLDAPNSVAPFTIHARDTADGEWRRVASATFYRLNREGVELQSPPVEIGVHGARYWSLRLDPRSPGLGAAKPSFEAHWRPAQVVFVARGEPPYTLAFGHPEAKRAVLAVNELIPGYERRDEMKLAEARLGEVRTAAESMWRRVVGDVNPRKSVLWSVLVLAVVALAFMAWRLQRQMAAKAPSPLGEGRGEG